MSLEVSIDREKRRIRMAWIGPIDGARMVEADEAFRAEASVDADFDQLIDLRRIEIANVPAQSISTLTSRPPYFAKTSRRAFVVPSDLAFGLSRMFEQMRGEEAGEIRVFREMSEAEAWLDEKA